MAINNNQTTPKDAQEALKKILNLDNSTNPDYEYTDPIKGVDIVQTPKDKLDTSIGIREDGVLQLIDPNAINDFYYKISFPGTNTLVNAKLTEGLGFSWTPTGNWIIGQNGTEVYEVTENVELKLKALNESSQWIIIGVKNPLTIIPGADAITRFSSQFIVHNDYISMTNGESVATIEKDTDKYLQQALDDDTIIVVEENDIILKKNSSQERVTDDYIVITNGISLTTIGEDEQQFLQDALNENSTIVVEENDIILKKDTSIEKITNDEIFLQTKKSKIDMTDESITLTNDYTKELTYLEKKILKDNPNNHYSQINVAEDKLTLLNGNSEIDLTNDQITLTNQNSIVTVENGQVTVSISNANTDSSCPGNPSANNSPALEFIINDEWVYINGQKVCVCPCGPIPTQMTLCAGPYSSTNMPILRSEKLKDENNIMPFCSNSSFGSLDSSKTVFRDSASIYDSQIYSYQKIWLANLLTDIKNNPLNNENVSIFCDGILWASGTTGDDGSINGDSWDNHLSLPNGIYTITADFSGNNKYASSTITYMMYVLIETFFYTSEDYNSFTFSSGTTENISVPLVYADQIEASENNSVMDNFPNQTVNFFIDDKPIGSTTTDSNGNAILEHQITESIGDHNLTFTYEGNTIDGNLYASCSNVCPYKVVPGIPNLTIQSITDGIAGRPVNLIATLEFPNGAPPYKTPVSFLVNGEVVGIAYTGTHPQMDGNSITAIFPYTGSDGGNYSIEAQYDGGTYGEMVVNSGSASSTMFLYIPTFITGGIYLATEYSSITISATLTNALTNTPLEGKTINSCNGIAITDSTGTANITYMAGAPTETPTNWGMPVLCVAAFNTDAVYAGCNNLITIRIMGG